MTNTRDIRTAGPTITVSARRVRLSLAPLTVNDSPAPIGSTVSGPHTAADVARAVIGSDIAECLLAIFLDARHRVTGYSEIARGTLNASRFAPRDVFIPALHANAATVIVAHNHPSGDATPSRADRVATDALREAGRLIGLPLTDHVIVTPDAVYSFRERDGWGD
jgi:DNA repair protein RadC